MLNDVPDADYFQTNNLRKILSQMMDYFKEVRPTLNCTIVYMAVEV